MADLTMNTPRTFRGEVDKGRQEVGANVRVFVGQAMMAGSGGIVTMAAGSGNDFIGFADESVDNRTNSVPYGGAARAAKTDLATKGIVKLTVANSGGWSYDDVGTNVNASDGNTFTVSSGGGANVRIGNVVDVQEAVVAGGEASADVWVYFNTGLVADM